MKEIIAYTDGGSDDNPGLSGWAFYIPGEVKCSGYAEVATNNEMELKAMIECLKYIGRDREATVFSDSTYVVKGITEWIYGWKRRNWITSSGTPVANRELWEELFPLYNDAKHKILYVKGHSGIDGNETCDQLVQLAKQSKTERLQVNLKQNMVVHAKDILEQFNELKEKYNNLVDYDKRLIAGKLYSGLITFSYQVKSNGE